MPPVTPQFWTALLRRLRREEGGFTLIEVMVVSVLLSVVVGATLFALIPSMTLQSRTSTRNTTTQNGSTLLERMDREMRSATHINVGGNTTPTTPSGKIDLLTSGEGTLASPQHVSYDCTSGSCTRAVSSVSGNAATITSPLGATHTVITGVTNPSAVFGGLSSGAADATDPSVVSLKLDLSLGTGFTNPVELQDAVGVRNLLP